MVPINEDDTDNDLYNSLEIALHVVCIAIKNIPGADALDR